ncbi:integrase arm-type DNA-binding domain-containing protein [[Pasteurella] aerogenes]|nr:integrase arm-type DNA-binding domain-containing protein [[Pasteurella] aerogenes]
MQYKLTDTKIRQAKSKDKDYPLADGGGLRLIVRANGSKVFVFNYNRPYTKKKNNITLGAYPEISLKQARERHAQARALLAQDIDPVQQREQDKREQVNKLDRTFGKMAVNWFEQRKQQADFSERTAKDTWALFERHILPNFAQYPITEITPLIAINALKPLEKDGKLETVRKVIGKLNDVMKFALHRGFISTNNLSDIHKEFDKPVTQGMKTITPEEIEEFLTALYQEKNNQRFSVHHSTSLEPPALKLFL